ncbi:MAG: AAA family ATPase, partial [Planctomycetota bacterium]
LLSRIVQGIERVEYRTVGQREALQFKQDVGMKHSFVFEALHMSDGTLRVLGVLLAVYQLGNHSLVAIEEPEATIHPAAAELLVEVLLDAAKERQILLTTHSPDILDHKDLEDPHIRVVTAERNRTLISPLSESSREGIRKRLYTPGELLRAAELTSDTQVAEEAARQLSLFGPPDFKEDETT